MRGARQMPKNKTLEFPLRCRLLAEAKEATLPAGRSTSDALKNKIQ